MAAQGRAAGSSISMARIACALQLAMILYWVLAVFVWPPLALFGILAILVHFLVAAVAGILGLAALVVAAIALARTAPVDDVTRSAARRGMLLGLCALALLGAQVVFYAAGMEWLSGPRR
jgi:hypothetical protein